MTTIADLVHISAHNLASVDLTPFDEPIEFKVHNMGKGYRVECRLRINYRWGTECEWLESNRIFGHKGDLDDIDLKKQFIKAFADMHEKRLWVFQANHGLLDREEEGISGKIRFKK